MSAIEEARAAVKLLRATATTVRDTAAKAPGGPWQFVEDLYEDHGAIMSCEPGRDGWDRLVMDVHHDSEHPAAAWAVLASPLLAPVLDDLLTRAADDLARAISRARTGSADPLAACDDPAYIRLAVRIARALAPTTTAPEATR
ncbi:hypothetical protein ACFVH6_22220 [Spirillospora sp. NPDC127200]